MLTEDDPLRLGVPRDRESSFEPLLLPQHVRRFTGFDNKIIAMYARGMPCARSRASWPTSTASMSALNLSAASPTP